MNFRKNPLYFGFFSTAAFWAVALCVFSAIPATVFRKNGAKSAQIRLFLSPNAANFAKIEPVLPEKIVEEPNFPAQTAKNDLTDDFSSEKIENPAKETAEIPQKIRFSPTPVAKKTPAESRKIESDGATVKKPSAISPAEKIEPKKIGATAKIDDGEKKSDPFFEKTAENPSKIAEKSAEISPKTADLAAKEVSTKSETAPKLEIPQENLEKSAENPQNLTSESAAASVATSERFSAAEFFEESFGAKIVFSGFFKSQEGIFALKNADGRAISLENPKSPKMNFSPEIAKNLPESPVFVNFRVLPTGAVPVSGVSVSPALSAEIQNAVKIAVSGWRFEAGAQSAALRFSFEARHAF